MAFDRVFVRHGAYHYDLGRNEHGKRRSKMLCRVSDGEAAMYEALGRLLRRPACTIDDLLTEFLAKGMDELSPRTKSDYIGYVRRRLRKHFGHMAAADLQPTHVAQYLERRKQSGGKVVANKEIACLASAYEYGQRVGICNGNPCRQVRRNKTKPKTRYVRHDEFLSHFDIAPEHVQDLMAGIYLMELRPGEARELRRADSITPQGIRFEESKTGKLKLIEWSPALQFFLTRATSRHPSSPFIFTNSRGEKWTEWAMYSAMQRLREELVERETEAAAREGREPQPLAPFTWHDLRAKGESDHQDGGMGLLPLYRRARRHRPVA